MKKVIITKSTSEIIHFEDIPNETSILGREKRTGKINAMVVRSEKGYITAHGRDGSYGSTGYHETLEECLRSDSTYYDFFVDL